MTTHPTIEALSRLETLLSKSKSRYHAMPSWWTNELVRFYDSGKRQSVWRVGRRGGKSSTVCRIVCLEAYYGDHSWPDDDEGVVMIISADQKQAKQRLRSCAVILREMKLQHDQTADELRFKNARGQSVVIRVHSASIASVVGCTCICAVLDEVARWGENDRTGNPSDAILESLIPTMATQPNAKIFMISSPMGEDDLHAKAFAEGETAFQTTHFAATWTANPTLTEAYCRDALSKTERIFKREYAAIPQGAFEHGFYDFQALIDASDKDRSPEPPNHGGFAYAMACDPGFLHDCFALAIAHAEIVDGATRVVLDYYKELRAPVTPDSAIDFAVGMRSLWPGGFGIVGDQASGALLTSEFSKKGVMYIVDPWSAASLVEKHSAVRDLIANRALRLPKWGALQKQLARLGVKLTASGGETIASVDGHMGDAASAAVAAIFEAWKHAPMTEAAENGAFRTFGRRVEGLHTSSSGTTENDDAFTKSERCNICNEPRGKCPHTA
ncbi:MAG TPA: hypothetical protein VN894_21150 [Polyangiaceae bacterium]|nr:hypothetical protein [Polyangiaceae bacterium]